MAAHLDDHIATAVNRANASGRPDDENEDALLDALEDDPELVAFREQRMEALHNEWKKQKEFRRSGHGSYEEINNEKELMDITTSTKLCVVHFWKSDFNRCRIMDSHLETLAPLHLDTRFLKINVTNAAFLVTKMKIQVLPCVIAFIDGVSTDRIVGFEGLGRGTDRFNTRDLEARLLSAGVLARPVLLNDPSLKVQTAAKSKAISHIDDVDDDDWD